MYNKLGDIRPAVEERFGSEDVSTTGGSLRHQNEDYRVQIAQAHHEIDLLCLQVNLDVPKRNHEGLDFTVGGRISILRDLVREGKSPYLKS